jgi:dolichyl-phosphate beta-glucosyltransferase
MKEKLTLLIPCYNSSSFIGHSFSVLESYLANRAHLSILLIDDCSKDDTYALLLSLLDKSLCKERIRVIKNEQNLGKGGTLKRGIGLTETGLVVFTDPDLAYELTNIDAFYHCIQPKQILIANRVHPQSRYLIPPAFFRYIFTRHLSSRFFNLIARTFLVNDLEDSQAGLKMFYADEIKPLLPLSCKSGFSFDLELLCIAELNHIRMIQMPVNFRYDHETTTVSFLSDAGKMLNDIFDLFIRKKRGKYKLPHSF